MAVLALLLSTRTPVPPGRSYGFEFTFRRLADCPTRFVWRWGFGEGEQEQPVPLKVQDECREGLDVIARNEHVFATTVPRRVVVVAMAGDQEAARDCTRWPGRTPC